MSYSYKITNKFQIIMTNKEKQEKIQKMTYASKHLNFKKIQRYLSIVRESKSMVTLRGGKGKESYKRAEGKSTVRGRCMMKSMMIVSETHCYVKT